MPAEVHQSLARRGDHAFPRSEKIVVCHSVKFGYLKCREKNHISLVEPTFITRTLRPEETFRKSSRE